MNRVCQLEPLLRLAGVLAALTGCELARLDPGTEAGAGRDAGPSLTEDAAAFADASGVDGSIPTAGRESDCFDFLDDDGDRAIDCADPGCGDASVCCAVGDGALQSACCTAGTRRTLDLGTCGIDSDARGCASGSGFGSAPLWVMEGLSSCGAPASRALVPGPDEAGDTGLVLPEILDPAVSQVEVSFTLGVAPRAGLGRAGIALIDEALPGARVVPVLGVVGSQGEIRVLVGEAEVFRSRVDAFACATAIPLSLRIEPRGHVTLSSAADGAPLFEMELRLPARARLAVYGRHDAGTPAAWIGDISWQRDVCSRLAPERASEPVIEGVSAGAHVGRVSIARRIAGEPGRAAIEIDGRIFPASEVASGVRVDDMVNPLVESALAASGPDWALGASDPQLLASGAGYQLLFTGRDADGSTAIFGRAFSETLGTPTVAIPLLTLDDARAQLDPAILAVDHPAYLEFGGRTYLLVRVTTATATALRVVALGSSLTSALADGVAPVASGIDAAYAESGVGDVLISSGRDDFARDEVGSARFIDIGDGVLRIFYAGRRGTRWSIGALVTVDLLHYDRVLDGAALLGPSGTGFDALGALDPEPVAEPAETGVARLTLFYTGTTGTTFRLGAATQMIHVGASP